MMTTNRNNNHSLYKKIIGVFAIIALILLFIVLTFVYNGKEKKQEALYYDVFDTVTRITSYDEKEAFDMKASLLYERLKEYHKEFDIYHEYEGINNAMTLNKNAGIKEVSVSDTLIDVLTFSGMMYEKTGGKVNICLGSVLKLWHEKRGKGTIPNEEELLSAKKSIPGQGIMMPIPNGNGWESYFNGFLLIDRERKLAYLPVKGSSIDLGSIGKGYASSRLAEYALEIGFTNGILSVGGNIVALGTKNGKEWNIGIEIPDNIDEKRIEGLSVNVSDKAVVTSGDYQRYVEVDGIRYCHIINPDTLMPPNYYRSVTVVTKDAGVADALSTALFCVDVSEGEKIIKGFDDKIEVILIDKNGSIERYEN